MRTFIVPAMGKTNRWRSFFTDQFQTKDQQEILMADLVYMAGTLPIFHKENRQHVRLGLMLDCMSLIQDYDDRGMLYEDDLDYVAKTAADISGDLAYFLNDLSVMEESNGLKFEGFAGRDLIVSVLNEEEWLDLRERLCRTEFLST